MIDSLQTVVLTPSHYFDEPEKCFKHNRGHDRTRDWIGAGDRKVLHPEVYWWLREHVGFERNEVWDVDRYFYPDEILPVIPRGDDGAWIAAENSINIKFDGRGYSHDTTSNIIHFNSPRDAARFRKRFSKWHQSWDLIKRAKGIKSYRYPDRRISRLVRQMLPMIAVMSHRVPWETTFVGETFVVTIYDDDNFTDHCRIFYPITENVDHERVLFMIAHQGDDPWITE